MKTWEAETRKERRERGREEEKLAIKLAKASKVESTERFAQVLALIALACTFGSWAWTVISPNSSAAVGSVLLFLAVLCLLAAIQKQFSLRKPASIVTALVLFTTFAAFDWRIVIKPQQGKPFQDLLVHGYDLESECGNIPAKQEMPPWMRDESKEWQAQVDQLVSQKLGAKDAQIWQGAIVIGRTSDVNLNAYQCNWLSTKVSALETIIATEFHSRLKHRDYNGPTYYFEAVNGKVDISDAFKGGKREADVAIEDFGDTNKGAK